jgi:hypothetical protein
MLQTSTTKRHRTPLAPRLLLHTPSLNSCMLPPDHACAHVWPVKHRVSREDDASTHIAATPL